MMDLDDWAVRHHGLITRAASGLSDDAWRRAIRAGHLDQLHPLVARLPGTATTVEQRIAAAVLAAGPEAIASHRSAAHLWGMAEQRSTAAIDITVLDRNRGVRLAGVIIHRPTDLEQLIPQRRHGVACTNVLRTLCDLGAVAPELVERSVGHVLSERLANLESLEGTLVRHARPGRTGVAAMRAAIDAWTIDTKPADSVLEAAMHRLVERYQLPALHFHPVIEGWEVDFRVADSIILIECDGWTTHGLQRRQFERDREKSSELSQAGWITLRLTYRAIVGRPSATAERIRRNVERWAEVPPPDRLGPATHHLSA